MQAWTVRTATIALGGLVLLAACSSKPAPKPWQVRSASALEVAEAAWLDGDTPVAQLEWQRARAQLARTGDPAELAPLALRQCALRIASLDWEECSEFVPLAAASGAAARAYAAYLAGQSLPPEQRALLPQAQQHVAALQAADAAALAAVAAVADPLSRLVAVATLARRSGQMPLPMMELAVRTAAEQGWRRPLLAWLLRQQSYAQQHQLEELLEHTRLRIAIVQDEGLLQGRQASQPQ